MATRDRRSQVDDTGTIVIEEERLSENYTRVPNTILRHPDLSPGAKLCYAMLLSYAHYQNYCFPGQERLAQDVGGGVRSVYRYLKELETAKLLRVKRRGLGKTNVYTLAKWVETRSAKTATLNLPSAIMADTELPQESTADRPEWPGEKDSLENDQKEKRVFLLLGEQAARLIGKPRLRARMAQHLEELAHAHDATAEQIATALAWVRRVWQPADGEHGLVEQIDQKLRDLTGSGRD